MMACNLVLRFPGIAKLQFPVTVLLWSVIFRSFKFSPPQRC